MLALALTGLAGFTEIPSVRYVPPPDRGTPPSDRGTGSRGDCLYRADLPPMAALVGEPHLSLTVSDRPTLWAYLPYTTNDASHAEAVLQRDSDDQELYRSAFPLGTMPGITGIRFSNSAPALEVGETYRWYIDIPCSPENSAATPATLTGVVKRVAASPELTQALQAVATPVETLAAYGEHHIWYDLLSKLAEHRLMGETEARLEQTNFEQLWIDVLSDEAGADLGDYAEAPLVGVVTVEAIAASYPLE
ncbi:MAG: DUF928 domain-containing protein [Phormidesmis sp.]